MTSAPVITDPVSKVKYPLFVEELVPDLAIFDANLVVSVPANVTANTGMDVLTHSMEAYVSRNATDFTDALAEKAVRLTIQSLEACYTDGRDLDN